MAIWSQEGKIDELIDLAMEEQTKHGSTGKALAYWLHIYDLVQDHSYKVKRTEVCMSIAQIYEDEGLLEQALPYYLEVYDSLRGKEELYDNKLNIHTKLGLTYAQLSKPDSAFYYFEQIFLKKNEEGNLNGQINTLQDMSKAFSINKQYENALKANLRIKQLVEENNRSSKERLAIYNNLGYNYNHLKQYEESIEYFEKAVELLSEDDVSEKEIINTNIGVAHYNLGSFTTSLEYLIKARESKARFMSGELAEIDQLLATVYLKKGDFHNALTHVKEAKKIALNDKNSKLLTDVYYTKALIHSELYEYDLALENYQRHLSLKDSFALEEKLRQQELLQQQINLERTEKQVKLFMINESVKELTIAQLKAEAANQKLAIENQEVQLLAEKNEKEILRKENELKESQLRIQSSENERAKQDLELARQKLKVSQQEKEYAALQQIEALQELEIKNKESQLIAEQNEKSILLRDKEINELELQKRNEKERYFYGIGALLSLILLLVGGGLVYSRRLNQELNQKNIAIERQKNEIDLEKKKSDNLLLNILPEQIASELKDTGKAKTRKHENVTILFTDFKDFTKLVASIPAQKLVKELNEIFSRFDDIMDKFNIEKIETIGDAYLATCGLLDENTDHANRCILAALDMLDYLETRNKVEEIQWKMRVGIHSGPVVAGVVGKKKFAYDIFGDSVNTASRIESNGEPGKVNISQTTYTLVKERSEFNFESRGQIYAKGKGELNMWFVNMN